MGIAVRRRASWSIVPNIGRITYTTVIIVDGYCLQDGPNTRKKIKHQKDTVSSHIDPNLKAPVLPG